MADSDASWVARLWHRVPKSRLIVVGAVFKICAVLYLAHLGSGSGSGSGSACSGVCAPYPEAALAKYTDLTYQVRTPDLAVTGVVKVYRAGALEGVVLCEQKDAHKRALPGGFVHYGESVEAALEREIKEETGLGLHGFQQLRVYSNPDRDARRHCATVAFEAVVVDQTPAGADDVAACRVHPLADVERDSVLNAMALDHGKVLRDFIARGRLRDAYAADMAMGKESA